MWKDVLTLKGALTEDPAAILGQLFLLNYHENKFLHEYKNDNTEEDPAQSLKKRGER